MAEPVDVATAKGRLGIASNHRDTEIEMLISAAREEIEDLSGHILMRRDVFEALPRVEEPCFEVCAWPVREIKRLIYVDDAGEEQEIAGADLRKVNSMRPVRIGPLVNASLPTDIHNHVIVVTAGYLGDEAEPYPPKLIQALLVLVGLWFEDHEGQKPIPQQVRDVCASARAWLV